MSHSAPNSIADTTLGFTPAELQLFRQHQQIVAQRRAQEEAVASRGRGASRHSSNPSSRAASAASSGGQGRVFLDPRNLQSLYTHFENIMRQIQSRIEQLEDATQRSVQANGDRAQNAMQQADAEIDRMRRIISEIDKLEADFDRVKHIRDVVKQVRARVDDASHRLERSQPSSHGHHHSSSGHGSGRHDPRRR